MVKSRLAAHGGHLRHDLDPAGAVSRSFAAQTFLREHLDVEHPEVITESVAAARTRGNPLARVAAAALTAPRRGPFAIGEASRSAPRAISATWRQGGASLFNLNAYAFGLSALFTGVGSGIIPLLVTGLTDRGRVHFLWMDLDKNGAIAVVSLCGLIMAAVVQPVAGFLSDRSQVKSGHRTTFMAIGAVGLVAAAMSLGTADAFGAMLIAVIWLQVFGNLIQGPANALLVDHVPPSRIGAAAGLLNVFKVAGAGVFVITVLLLMDNYDRDTGRVWLWASLVLLVCVMVASALWTILSLRPDANRGPTRAPAFAEGPAERPPRRGVPPSRGEGRRRGAYLTFLLSLVFVIAAMSAMQVYSIPFLEDAVGLANPARGAALLALVVAVSTAGVAVPAGRLQDRIGHRPLLLAAGVSGAAAALLLMAAHTLVHVMFIGIVAGFSIGIFVSVTWAMANGLVPRTAAARELGYTGVATLAGAALARIGGPGIDALNAGTLELGYRVMLGAIALAFLISPALLWLVAGTGSAREPGESGRTV